MIAISTVLDSVLKRTTDWRMRVITDWPHIMGPLSERILVEKIDGTTLFVHVGDSAWMQELYLLSDLLVDRVNQAIGHPHIKKIHFKSGAKKTLHTAQPRKNMRAQNTFTLNTKEKDALAHIADTQLRTALEQFLIRCRTEHHS